MYEYDATIRRVVDGDTFDADVDLGFRTSSAQRFRLRRFNAPEMRGPERELGKMAKARVSEILRPGSVVRLRTHKGDAFGRWLADVETPLGDLTDRLLEEGFGVFWDGRGRRPSFSPDEPYPMPPDQRGL